MKTRLARGLRPGFLSRSDGLDAYAAGTPVLDLRSYLCGTLSASGAFFGLTGRMERRFEMEMVGRWSGNRGTLDERLCYDNGESMDRRWTLDFADDGTFVATAPDVEGPAPGAQRGHAAVMHYRLRLPWRQGEIVVGMEDRFFLLDDGTLVNRARMSKFGLKVGEVIAFFRRDAAEGAPETGRSPS